MLEFSSLKRNDRRELCELNKKLVPRWFQYANNDEKQIQSKWENLTIRDRFMHGGPWLDRRTLDIHFDLFEKFGQVIVARDTQEDIMIGELEWHYSNNTAHIDWMMVSPEEQRKGIGSMMINHLKEIVIDDFSSEIWTEPEKGTDYFYETNGFDRVLPELISYSIRGSSKLNMLKWKSGLPPEKKTLIGDATNTKEYSRFLLQAEEMYASVFNVVTPISYAIPEDHNLLIIRRKISALKNRSVILFYSDVNIPESQIISLSDFTAKSLPKIENIFITLPGISLYNWKIHEKIFKRRKLISI